MKRKNTISHPKSSYIFMYISYFKYAMKSPYTEELVKCLPIEDLDAVLKYTVQSCFNNSYFQIVLW